MKDEDFMRMTHDDPMFLPTQYGLTEQQLNQLAEDYDRELIPAATKVGDEGYTQIHNKVMAITKVRTKIDKIRKSLKEDSLKWGRKVDGEAKRLTQIVERLEAPWKRIKLDLEEDERKASEAKLAAEQRKQAEIEGRIKGIRDLAEGMIGADAIAIQSRIDQIDNMVISVALFSEFQEAAKLTGDIVRKSLIDALEERTAFEAEQAEMEVLRKQYELDKAELKREQKKVFDEKLAIKASEDAAKATEEAESQRKAHVKEAAQRAADAAQANKKRVGYLKERMPQDKALRDFADKIEAVACPDEINDHDLINVLDDALDYLVNVVAGIRAGTQEVK